MRISFHGAAETVTGSRHLLEVGGRKILVDAGLFQGLKQLRRRNWNRPAFDPAAIDAVLLTHTHIDHAGYLPRLLRDGFTGSIHCTPATRQLAEIVLLDAAKIQEEDAHYANKKGFSRHRPAEPLFDTEDVGRTLERMQELPYGRWLEVDGAIRARFLNVGHILGSAMVETHLGKSGDESHRLLFSGDVGRYDMPLHPDPTAPPACDSLVIESTYGNRKHDYSPLEDQLLLPLRRCLEHEGVVLIPAFAVGRSQQVTLILRRLMERGRLPQVPIHIDSPMAVDATRIYSQHLHDHNLDDCLDSEGRSRLFPRHVHFHRSRKESKELNALAGPRVIISASGMMTGGRILHHLTQRLPDPKNLLCLVGYQAAGTRGRKMLEGARHVRIHGYDVPVRAEFLVMHGLSGHADHDELLRWVESSGERPRTVFVTHGEPKAAAALGKSLAERLEAVVHVPRQEEGFALG